VLIEERPNMVLDERTKELRQMCFKERFKRRQLIMAHAWPILMLSIRVCKDFLSHPTFRRKPSANLYACQDQVSCI
jgi:hypothetical protein